MKRLNPKIPQTGEWMSDSAFHVSHCGWMRIEVPNVMCGVEVSSLTFLRDCLNQAPKCLCDILSKLFPGFSTVPNHMLPVHSPTGAPQQDHVNLNLGMTGVTLCFHHIFSTRMKKTKADLHEKFFVWKDWQMGVFKKPSMHWHVLWSWVQSGTDQITEALAANLESQHPVKGFLAHVHQMKSVWQPSQPQPLVCFFKWQPKMLADVGQLALSMAQPRPIGMSFEVVSACQSTHWQEEKDASKRWGEQKMNQFVGIFGCKQIFSWCLMKLLLVLVLWFAIPWSAEAWKLISRDDLAWQPQTLWIHSECPRNDCDTTAPLMQEGTE